MNTTVSVFIKTILTSFFIVLTTLNKEKLIKNIANKPTNSIKSITDAQNLYLNSKKNNTDSVHIKVLQKLTIFSYRKKNWQAFNKYRLEHLKLATTANNIKAKALILDYSGAYFKSQNKKDSAYYYYNNAYKAYSSIKDSLRAGNMLLNIAIIQKNVSNFKESETTSFKALTYLKNTKNKRTIASIYNNLGIIYKGLEDYNSAIKYHKKAYIIRQKIKNTFLEISSLNNIGNVYKEQKKYKKAIFNYTKALAFDSILNKNSRFKAKLIDNYAFALFLNNDTKNLPQLFFDALKIRDSIKNKPGQIVSNIHLGTYYKSINKKQSAINYLETAVRLSNSINYKKDQLEAMALLLDLYPAKKAVTTAKQILFTKDSLKKAEYKIKESISKIQYETSEKENIILQKEKELQNEVIAHNKKKTTLLIFIILFITILLAVLLVWFLKYKQQQQFKNGFTHYLKNKYNLTDANLEFWTELIEGLTQEELADKLCISLNGVKSRRKALFAKIKTITEHTGTFDKAKAILLYKKEVDLFKKTTSKLHF